MLQIESDDFALSVVVVSNKKNLVETYVLADVQATRTYDLRLARFHLFRKPWITQPIRTSYLEELAPALHSNNGANGYSGSLSGRGPPSTLDDDGLSGGHVRSPSKLGARSIGGSVVAGSVTLGAYEGSRGGENGESVHFCSFTNQYCSAL
jgi:hypothetical protein